MKKLILFTFLFLVAFQIGAQTIESDKYNAWNSRQTITFSDDQGIPFIEMPNRFSRDKQLKKQTKVFTLDGETYQIVCERKYQNVYKEGNELVAKMNRWNDKIHLASNNKTYQPKGKLFSATLFYIDENGTEVTSCQAIRNRKYRLSSKKEGMPNQKLLMVLTLHQFLERQHEREVATNAALWVYN